MRYDFLIRPRAVGLTLAALALYLALQSLISEFLIEQVLDTVANPSFALILDLFSVNLEASIPTWYATLLLFAAAVVLALIASGKVRDREPLTAYWIGLTLIFLYLSMDEGAMIHEIAADWLQESFELSGFLTFGWQIVAFPIVIVVGLLYLRFVLRLPPRTRNLFIAAGIIYLSGAMVIEGLSASRYDLDGGVSFPYLAIATVEELFEMLGVVLFIYALLDYWRGTELAFTVNTGDAIEAIPETEDTTATPPKRPRWIWVVLSGVIVMNVLFIGGALLAPTLDEGGGGSPVAVEGLVAEVSAAEDVVITRMQGGFGQLYHDSHAVVVTLSSSFDEIVVINVIGPDISVAIASDVMPFDRDYLAEVLHKYGAFEFIIFDPPAVQAILRMWDESD